MVLLTPAFRLIADYAGSFAPSWTFLAALTAVGVVIAIGACDRTNREPRGSLA